jgi:LacI family transcriptional regulator
MCIAMSNNATLKKISEHLSVSISTVSRALKDHPDVSPETKRRVKELATMLDYEPNAFAVNLRKKHSNLFAVIVPEISNFFYHSFIQAVEEESRRMGFSLMILQSMNDSDIEEQNLRLCRHNHVAGIFIAITDKTTNLLPFKKLETLDIPLVFFDKVPDDDTFNKVSIADYDSGKMAAEHLLKGSTKDILAILGNGQLSITQRREKGFVDFCKAFASSRKLDVEYADDAEAATAIVLRYFNETPRHQPAIFSMSDEIMCGVLKALNQLHLKLPDDAKLISISNGFLPSLFSPEISYVKTSGYELGKLSFSRMNEILGGKKFIRENFLNSTYHPGGSV